MKITKSQIFSLYLANENQKVKYFKGQKPNVLYELRGMVQDRVYLAGGVQLPVTDCKLLLKDIADMSEGDKADYRKLQKELPDVFFGEEPHYVMGSFVYLETIQSVLYLIKNGYCLDTEWVKAGWVEIVRGE